MILKCLNCGKESKEFLCENCRTEKILDKVFNEIKSYTVENCGNEFIHTYAETFEKPYEVRTCIPEILKLFNNSAAEYYYCRYYWLVREEKFEENALSYLDSHEKMDCKKQTVLNDLLTFYLRNDFVKPRKWCELIKASDNLCCELYYNAAQFFAMIGEYDFADEIIDKALAYCSEDTYNQFLFYPREKEMESLTKLKADNHRYRTKKPYWPSTQERRCAVAAIYDKKGISYPRIEPKPLKIKECDFIPIKETVDTQYLNYCAFWCAEVFVKAAIKGIYQIAAVKIRNGEITNEFQSYVRPWDGMAGKKAAAKEAGIDVSVLDMAQDVDQVISRFFDFIGNDVLISTEALGNQAKLISRAARYSGMKEITNRFFDLLDYAADISAEFDMQNNTRKYLLDYFKLSEGKDSLEKAKRNVDIYNCLNRIGD